MLTKIKLVFVCALFCLASCQQEEVKPVQANKVEDVTRHFKT